ncbi:22524_t:CDS:2, partial [Entrophospora sp. SA101]
MSMYKRENSDNSNEKNNDENDNIPRKKMMDLGYAMAIHTSQGMTLKAPQCVWVIDEHLAWDDLIYLAIDCVKYLNHPIQIEDPPLLLLLRLKKNLIMKEKRKL